MDKIENITDGLMIKCSANLISHFGYLNLNAMDDQFNVGFNQNAESHSNSVIRL